MYQGQMEQRLLELVSEILDMEGIELTSDFFELGGDSLDATILLNELRKNFGIEIVLTELFQSSTVQELAGLLKNKEKALFQGIKPVEKSEVYPLSGAQYRMYALSQFETDVPGYNVSRLKVITGRLDYPRLMAAGQKLLDRHEILRTSFHLEAGGPVQKIHPTVELKIAYFDGDEEAAAEIGQEFIQKFDLTKAPLFRLGVIKCTEEKNILLLDMSHIISDKTSVDIFITDLFRLYQGEELPPLTVQYKDYAAYQNDLLSGGHLQKQEEFWLSRLGGKLPLLNLPLDYPRPEMLTYRGDRVEFLIDAELTASLKKLAAEEGVTLYMLLLAVYNVLLAKYTEEEDIIIGTPVVGRTHADVQAVIGMCINTLPVRSYPTQQKTFRGFLAEVKQEFIQALENQDYPLEKLVEKLALARIKNRNPLFDAGFNMVNAEYYEFGLRDKLVIQPFKYKQKRSIFDILLIASETAQGLEMEIEYRTALFKPATIGKMAEKYRLILEQISANLEIRLQDIQIFTELLQAEAIDEEGDFAF